MRVSQKQMFNHLTRAGRPLPRSTGNLIIFYCSDGNSCETIKNFKVLPKEPGYE